MSRRTRKRSICKERAQASGNFSNMDEQKPSSLAIIYRSEMDYISRCILDYPNIETGGQLFGFVTENGAPVVCYAIGPGKNANHQPAFFNQDTEYLQATYNELNRRYGLRYIGEWHSHHQLGLARPSGHDSATIIHGMQRNNFRHFLLCIGNCDNHNHSTLNAFTFFINNPQNFFHAPWKIIDMDSPYRSIVDNELQHSLCHPLTEYASYGANYILSETGQTTMITPNYSDNYWLNQKSNNLVLKNIIDYLSNYNGVEREVNALLDENKHVHLIVQGSHNSIHISFGEKFPYETPVISTTNTPFNNAACWHFNGDIFDSFKNYYDDTNRITPNL